MYKINKPLEDYIWTRIRSVTKYNNPNLVKEGIDCESSIFLQIGKSNSEDCKFENQTQNPHQELSLKDARTVDHAHYWVDKVWLETKIRRKFD